MQNQQKICAKLACKQQILAVLFLNMREIKQKEASVKRNLCISIKCRRCKKNLKKTQDVYKR